MTMLSKLEEAIKKLERQKEKLILEIEDAGWEDDRVANPIPSREVSTLVELSLTHTIQEQRNIPSFIKVTYQKWYSAVHTIIAKNFQQRLAEVEALYNQGIKRIFENSYITKETQFRLLDLINQQFAILVAVPDHLRFSIYDIELTAYSILMDDELEAANYLLKNGFLRAAGALAGVTLERHLKNLLRKHTPPIKYSQKATLAVVNDLCKDTVYDTIVWRKVQHLTDLRNLCDHDKDREPTKDEVRELIDGVSAFLKNYPTP